jgi:hypothetical protein
LAVRKARRRARKRRKVKKEERDARRLHVKMISRND